MSDLLIGLLVAGGGFLISFLVTLVIVVLREEVIPRFRMRKYPKLGAVGILQIGKRHGTYGLSLQSMGTLIRVTSVPPVHRFNVGLSFSAVSVDGSRGPWAVFPDMFVPLTVNNGRGSIKYRIVLSSGTTFCARGAKDSDAASVAHKFLDRAKIKPKKGNIVTGSYKGLEFTVMRIG